MTNTLCVSDTFAGTAQVGVYDNLDFLGTADFRVYPNQAGPTLTFDVPEFIPVRYPLTWEATDPIVGTDPTSHTDIPGSGVRDFTVEYSENGGPWTEWGTGLTEVQTEFIGTPGSLYDFRITAYDNVNNATIALKENVEVKAVTKYYALGGQKVAMRQGDEVYYLHGDHLGSTSLTTDSLGGVISEVHYHPYGQERWANGVAVTDFGFTSQRNEASFGLMDYNARYYSPVLGRFVSPDTIVPEPGSSGGFNRYRYVRNNPLKYTDPTGHAADIGFEVGGNRGDPNYENALLALASDIADAVSFEAGVLAQQVVFPGFRSEPVISNGEVIGVGMTEVVNPVGYDILNFVAENTPLLDENNLAAGYNWRRPPLDNGVELQVGVVPFSGKFRSGNPNFPPNQGVVNKMNESSICNLTDCSDIAERLLDFAGEGNTLRVVPNQLGTLNYFDDGKLISDGWYHDIYTDGRYVYDPWTSSEAIPQGDWEKMMRSLNPQGIKILNDNKSSDGINDAIRISKQQR